MGSWEAAFGVVDMQLYALINSLACGIQVTVDMNIEKKQWQFFFFFTISWYDLSQAGFNPPGLGL